MRTVRLSEARDKLSELMNSVEREQEIYEITRPGRPAAVLIGKDALDSLYENLFWLSQPGIHEDVRAACAQAEAGRLHSAVDIRARYGSHD